MKAATTFTITTAETGAFTVAVGDKVVLVSNNRFRTKDGLPPHREIRTVSAIRGGKQPRIELADSAQTFDAEGKNNWR